MAELRDDRAVLIAGPTASGKSALALRLARESGGVIVNADSMQVYRDLRVLTARPTPADEHEVPHRLYGHVDASVNYSAGAFVQDAAKVFSEARAESRRVIVTGGTGLYFKALTRGLSAVPPILRAFAKASAHASKRTAPRHCTPCWRAMILRWRRGCRHATETRVARALEVIEATGISLSDWQGNASAPLLPAAATARSFSMSTATRFTRASTRGFRQ